MFDKRQNILIILFLIAFVLLAENAVYAASSGKSLFKNKKLDYNKLQEQKQMDLEREKNVLAGKSPSDTDPSYGKNQAKSVKLSSSANFSNIAIPNNIGSVMEVYEAPSVAGQEPKPLVVHIQDLHTNPEASFNLASILEILIKDYNLGLVCSEGADGEVDTSSVSSFPDPEVREKTAKLFVNSGELTGEEYLSITKYPDLPIWGIEEKELYFNNIAQFNKIMEYSPKAVSVITGIKNALDMLKPKIYSKQLMELDGKEAAYEESKIDTNQYLDYLFALSKDIDISKFKNVNIINLCRQSEKNTDKDAIAKESQALLSSLQAALQAKENKYETEMLLSKASLFGSQKITSYVFYSYMGELAKRHLKDTLDKYPNLFSFIEYLRNMNSLDSMGLFTEIGELSYETKHYIAENDAQKQLVKASRHIKLLEGFFNLKLSNEELDYYLANKDDFKIGFFENFLRPNLAKYNIGAEVDYDIALIDGNLRQLEDFYSTAHKRDVVLFNNAVKEIEKRKVKTAALISGGFHTEGIKRQLKENGYSYVVIAPYSNTAIDEENYRNLLSGKRKPIEDLVGELNEK